MSDTTPQPHVDHPTNCACPLCSALRYVVDITAQHTASVERRGAAKELRRLAGQVGNQFVGTRRYNTADLLARAAELEGV